MYKRSWMISCVFSIFVLSTAACASTPPIQSLVTLGQERLTEPTYAAMIAGKKIGILAHNASRDHDGNHIVDKLFALPGVQLKMIFAPEHGYRSVNDDLTPDSIDPVTGLPVYSLYGPRKAPTTDMLSQLDVVLIELQDVGLRYYTYAATMVYTLQTCKAAGKPVIILDRPNPIRGDIVEGAMLDSNLANGDLTTLAVVPTRLGMTFGELARYYNVALNINANVTVVPMSGWQRTMDWDATQVPWIPPSPALVKSEQSTMYTMMGTFESASLAVGRGQVNDLAFYVFGAPWITPADQTALVAKLKLIDSTHLSITPYTWTPDRDTYQGQLSNGVRISLLKKDFLAFNDMIAMLQIMKAYFGTRFDTSNMLSMLGSQWLLDGINQNTSISSLVARSQKENAAFLTQRAKALLY